MAVAASARWIGLSQASRLLAQFVGMSVLARFLSPADFGMMAMAAVLTTLAGMLREMGTGTAIIQRSQLDDATVSGIFWLNVALGVSAAVALLVLAPVLASAFRAPGLRDVLRALAPIF